MPLFKLLWFIFVEMTLCVCIYCTGEVVKWIEVASLSPSYFNIPTTNVARCEKICLRQKACVAATFDIFEEICYLHDQRYAAVETSGRYVMLNVSVNAHENASGCGDTELFLLSSNSEDGTCMSIKQCPIGNGFKLNSTTGICYKIITTKKTWHDANATCVDIGSHLMRFRNEGDWTIIDEELLGIPELVKSGRLWIDGNDLEGVWRDSSGIELVWTSWQVGEPSGGEEHFLNLMGYYGRHFLMNDEKGTARKPFICQYY